MPTVTLPAFGRSLSITAASLLLASLAALAGCDTGGSSPAAGPAAPAVDLRELVASFPPAARDRAKTLVIAVERNRKDADALGQLAMYAHAQGLPDVALRFYGRAAEASTGSFEWPYLRAVVLTDQGEDDAALRSLRKALQINPDYPPLRLRLAQLLLQGEQTDAGKALLLDLVRDVPGYPEACWTLGKLFLELGQEAAAIKELTLALAEVPHYGSAHYALAQAYAAIGEDEKAAAHRALFSKHNKSGPPNLDQLLGQVQDLRGTSQQAIVKAGRLSAAGKLPQAAQVLLQVLDNEPDNMAVHINLIGLFGALGETDKAASHYRRGLTIAPDQVKLHNNFGVLMLKQQRYPEAVDAFRRAVEADPNYATPYKYLGLSLQNLGRHAEAQQNFESAFAKDPLDHQAGYLLGTALMRAERLDEAIEVLTNVTETQSTKTAAYLRALAQAHELEGEREKAVEALNRAKSVAEMHGQLQQVAGIDAELSRLAATGEATP